MSNLEWTKKIDSVFWAPTMVGCASLNFDGRTGWRVPTLYEWQAAAIHGMVNVANANWISSADMNSYFWTSTMNATDDVSGLIFRPLDNSAPVDWKDAGTHNSVCVKP